MLHLLFFRYYAEGDVIRELEVFTSARRQSRQVIDLDRIRAAPQRPNRLSQGLITVPALLCLPPPVNLRIP